MAAQDLVLELQVDVINQTLDYKDVEKVIPESYWKDTLVPILYPNWDTDKDKLINFYWYSNGSWSAKRRKFVRNFAKNVDEWKDYEMEQVGNDVATALKDKLVEAFFLIDSIENQEYQEELGRLYSKQQAVSPLTVRMARNFLLSETDWTQSIADSPLSADEKAQYVTYRQKLRDITSTTEFNNNIDNIKFPISPEFYNKIWKVENPGVDYLATDTQFMKLGLHYLKQYREQLTQYMLVKNLTEKNTFELLISEYNQRKIPPSLEATAEEVEARKDFLEKIIQQVNDELTNGEMI